MELAESLQEESLLLVVGESESLDDLGGSGGTYGEGLSRADHALGTPLVLEDGSGLVDLLVSNMKLVNLSESFSGLGLSLLNLETVVGALGRLVVEACKVHVVEIEALISRLGTLSLDFGGGEVLG